MSQECIAPSGSVALDNDPGRSFVIRRRNGDSITVLVSELDYDRVVADAPWCVMVTKTSSYVIRFAYYGNGERECIYLHRMLLGAPKGTQVDHRNGNSFDNRRSNLRICDVSQNACNRGVNKRSASGIKGVSLHKRSGRWRASIVVRGTRISLGYFSTPEEAAAAYREAAIKHHGSFARFELPRVEGMTFMTPFDKKPLVPDDPWTVRLCWTLLFVAGALSLAALLCAAAGLPDLAYALAGLVIVIGVLLISAGGLS